MKERLERIEAALERIEAALQSRPAAALSAQPTFCGYACSWTEDRGLPAYVVTADGEMAHRHEKQGDVWWSIKDAQSADGYRRVLGFQLAEFDSLPASARFRPCRMSRSGSRRRSRSWSRTRWTSERCAKCTRWGRQLYDAEWPERGRHLIQAYSDGRTDTSAELTLHECQRLINNLQVELRKVRGPDYAGGHQEMSE